MSSRPPRELTRDQRAAIRKQVTKCCANYDNQDQLCLPLDCPCYMLQKWWTGSYCRYFREAVFPRLTRRWNPLLPGRTRP